MIVSTNRFSLHSPLSFLGGLIRLFGIILVLLIPIELAAGDNILKENLGKVQPGSYIVTAQNKTYTVFHIRDKIGQQLLIEEVAIPSSRISSLPFDWKQWIASMAPGYTSWIVYALDLPTGSILDYYAFEGACLRSKQMTQNFLSTLMHLELERIPDSLRKKVGPNQSNGSADWRQYWQPQMVYEGRMIPHVVFGAWKAQWPKDGTEMSNRSIEIYIPEDDQQYSTYFPYWLEIGGAAIKTKLRVIDSGNGMKTMPL